MLTNLASFFNKAPRQLDTQIDTKETKHLDWPQGWDIQVRPLEGFSVIPRDGMVAALLSNEAAERIAHEKRLKISDEEDLTYVRRCPIFMQRVGDGKRPPKVPLSDRVTYKYIGFPDNCKWIRILFLCHGNDDDRLT
jgi:hypothetical protein